MILDAEAQPFLGSIFKLNKKGAVRLELRGINIAYSRLSGLSVEKAFDAVKASELELQRSEFYY